MGTKTNPFIFCILSCAKVALMIIIINVKHGGSSEVIPHMTRLKKSPFPRSPL